EVNSVEGMGWLERFQILDQRQLVGVGKPCSEVVTAIFDQVRAFANFKQCRRNLRFENLGSSCIVEVLDLDLGERLLDLQTDLPELFRIRVGTGVGQQVDRGTFRDHSDAKITVWIENGLKQSSQRLGKRGPLYLQTTFARGTPNRIFA